jgi:hypothetical protein
MFMRLPTQERVIENRLRRMAKRQGLTVLKNRRLDRLAVDFGCYLIWDGAQEIVASPGGVSGSAYGLADLDALESWLEMPVEERPAPLGAPPAGSSPEERRQRDVLVREAVAAYRRAVRP